MAGLASHFNNLFLSLLLLLLHIGCFCFPFSGHNPGDLCGDFLRKRRKKSSSFISPQKAVSSSWYFLKRVFSCSKLPTCKTTAIQTRPITPATTTTTTSFCSPRSSQHSIIIPISDSDHPRKRRSGSKSDLEYSLCENPFLPLRNDIFPCPSCGEIFQKPNLLEHHQSVKHAVSELRDGDSGKNIVWIIFKTGWPHKERHPKIHRILKIHNSPKILSRYEEYRDFVKSRAARNGAVSKRSERCIADGNELLRFHCTTFVCNLGQNGNSSVCNQHYCSACGIIQVGFSPKLDGISTLSTGWGAHLAIPEEVEDEFAFMDMKRAMLVCRVIAGRVGCDPMEVVDKEDPGFDSLVGRSEASRGKLDEDELLVFNPRAVLPCFLIVYSV